MSKGDEVNVGGVSCPNVVPCPKIDDEDIRLYEEYIKRTARERYYHEGMYPTGTNDQDQEEKTLEVKIKEYIDSKFDPQHGRQIDSLEIEMLAMVCQDPFFDEMSIEDFTEYVGKSEKYAKFSNNGSSRTRFTCMRLKIEGMIRATPEWSCFADLSSFITIMKGQLS